MKSVLRKVCSVFLCALLFSFSMISEVFPEEGGRESSGSISLENQKIYFNFLQMIHDEIRRQNKGRDPSVSEDWFRKGMESFKEAFYSRAAVYAMLATTGEKNRRNDESRILLGRSLMALGFYPQMIQTLEKNNLAYSAEYTLNRQALLAEGYYQMAEYSKTLSTLSDGMGPLGNAFLNGKKVYLEGMSLFYMGDYLRAIQTLQGIQAESDYYPFSLYMIGLSYNRLGNPSMAISWIRRLTEVSPTLYSEAIYFQDWGNLILGELLMERDPHGALQHFEQIKEDSPFFKRSLYGMAWGYIKRGEYVKSIVLFRELWKQFPNTGEAWEGLVTVGWCYARLSAYEKAVSHYRGLLDQITQAIQQVDQELVAFNQGEKIFDQEENWGSAVRKSFWGEPIPGYSRFEMGFLLKEITNVEALGHSLGEKFYTQSGGGFTRLAESVRREMVETQQRALSQKKTELEELLVRASLGIARNLSPQNLGERRK